VGRGLKEKNREKKNVKKFNSKLGLRFKLDFFNPILVYSK
jgi:hypothetical protein